LPALLTISASQKNWHAEGISENRGAWLMTAAKRRVIDSLHHGRMLVQKYEEIVLMLPVTDWDLSSTWSRLK